MGSAESREGRRASFGMDEEERVRVLQGIRLSENVVNRMKEPGQPSRVGLLAPPAAALGPSGGREKDSKPPRPDCGSGRGPPRVQVDPLERCDWEQAVLQDELVRVATTEREAAASPWSVTLRRGEGGVDQEKQRLAQREAEGSCPPRPRTLGSHAAPFRSLAPDAGVLLSRRRTSGVIWWHARELESQEEELRCRDAFYKEQLGRLERQNLEAYRLSSQQFHEAATKIEGAIKPRRVEPVCSGLQAQILRCYRDRLQEVLLCADLVRAYQHCVSSAHKG
uniref:Coiled-coil-helix-coiled-coil-helix domain containing 6 n=1 Tax=Bos taurus TaxID=9913 RepID=A0A452DJA4_BOVIN